MIIILIIFHNALFDEMNRLNKDEIILNQCSTLFGVQHHCFTVNISITIIMRNTSHE